MSRERLIRYSSAVALVAMPSVSAAIAAPATPNGAAIFKQRCASCHSVEAGQNRIGPSLAEVSGRKAGAVPGYAYSAAMKASAVVWDDAKQDAFLTKPATLVPGTKMIFPGLAGAADRAAVIAFLKDQ